MKTKVKIPAKLNLTLDIVGVEGGYHNLKSLVVSVDLFDTLTLKARKDDKITLTTKGISPECSVTDNVAYKSAKTFMAQTGANGVDIVIDKKIPVGAGLGGSSADIAGVLKGMQALYLTDADISQMATLLGSDSLYMLKSGYAVMQGRGDKVTYLDINQKLYFLIITNSQKICAKQSYKEFDKLATAFEQSTDTAVTALQNGDKEGMAKSFKNDLYFASVGLLPQLKEQITALRKSGALTALMTGSGSAVYGVFADKKARDRAYKTLVANLGKRLIKAQTV